MGLPCELHNPVAEDRDPLAEIGGLQVDFFQDAPGSGIHFAQRGSAAESRSFIKKTCLEDQSLGKSLPVMGIGTDDLIRGYLCPAGFQPLVARSLRPQNSGQSGKANDDRPARILWNECLSDLNRCAFLSHSHNKSEIQISKSYNIEKSGYEGILVKAADKRNRIREKD